MRVLDGAILVIDAVMGVQAQSETVCRQMKRHHVPYVAFVNKLDRPGADYLAAVANIHKRLHVRALPVQYPIFAENGQETSRTVEGIVDLFDLTTIRFGQEAKEARVAREELPERVRDEVGVLRAELLEALSEDDDHVLRALLEGREVAREAASKAMRARVLAGTLIPVLCGVAQRNVGIQPLLDAVVEWLPSPLDAKPAVGVEPETGAGIERHARDDEPFCALAFKLQALAHGDLTFARIYSGKITSGAQVWNPRTKKLERVARILRMHANHGEGLETAGAGDIVAFTGLKHTATGDTLCAREAPIVLESLVAPEPVLSLVIEPADSADREKLVAALGRLVHEDPSFHAREDADTGQWLISGMGELHLEVLQHRLESEFHVKPAVGKPRVAYREAVVKGGRGASRVERTVGTREIFGAVELAIEPDKNEAHARIEWAPKVPIPSAHRRAIEETLRLEAEVGPRFGFPLGEVRIQVDGGASDPRRDAEMGFVQAAAQALRAALAEAEVALCEPWMRFEIQTPGEFSSGILADLNARHAELEEVTQDGAYRTLTGTVALSKMFGYSNRRALALAGPGRVLDGPDRPPRSAGRGARGSRPDVDLGGPTTGGRRRGRRAILPCAATRSRACCALSMRPFSGKPQCD
jgi:elongation factor G